MLLFHEHKDSHYNIENIDLVLLSLENRALENITNTPDILERAVSWNADGSLLIKKETRGSQPIAIERMKLEFEQINQNK